MNRVVALRAQGKQDEAMGDYSRAIEFRELLFDKGYVPAIVGLAMAYHNVINACRRGRRRHAEELSCRALAFMKRIQADVAIDRLSRFWQEELDDLLLFGERGAEG